ncbi:MAG: TrmH family RNA methyltransferase [Solirubrobacterales bacterium]
MATRHSSRAPSEAPFFVHRHTFMITSPQNEKLKLVRKLADSKHREREGLFATEGEDLIAAGLRAGRSPDFVLVTPGAGIDGDEVEAELLNGVSTLGSGTRAIAVWSREWAEKASAPCVYLHGVGDPANVGAIIRSADALAGGSVVLGSGCADPHSPKAVRASMGSVFGVEILRGAVESTPEPRLALVAHGAPGVEPAGVATLCVGSEREGLPAGVLDACATHWTIPLREGGAESLNLAAAAAIALQRISSAAAQENPLRGAAEH